MYFMKNLPTFAERPELLDEEGYFGELMEAAEFVSLDDKERNAYFNDVKMKGDYQNTIDFAREQGREEGEAIGKAKGLKAGEAKGRKEMHEEDLAEMTKKMLAEGIAPEVVARITGLTEAQIKALGGQQ